MNIKEMVYSKGANLWDNEPEILLHPNIPKPLHGTSPRTVLGKDWWDIERAKAYKAHNYHCFACGLHKSDAKYHKWLEAHEDYDINYKSGEVRLKRIVALCHCCHSFIHSGLLEIRHDKGEIDDERYRYILETGKKLIKGLRRKLIPDDIAAWNHWRLVIDGKSYYSKFNNYQEWNEYYAH